MMPENSAQTPQILTELRCDQKNHPNGLGRTDEKAFGSIDSALFLAIRSELHRNPFKIQKSRLAARPEYRTFTCMAVASSISPSCAATDDFRPTEDQVPILIDALCSPTLSVQQVATQFNTSLDALCFYITSSRGSESLSTLDDALAMRLRLVALSVLPRSAATLAAIVQDQAAHEKAQASGLIPKPQTLDDFKLQERRRVNARKASSLLYRLATLHPRVQHVPSRLPAPSRAAPPTTPPRTGSTPVTAPVAAPGPTSSLDPLDPLNSLAGFSIPRALRPVSPLRPRRAAAPLHIPGLASPATALQSASALRPLRTSPPIIAPAVTFAPAPLAAQPLVAATTPGTPAILSAPLHRAPSQVKGAQGAGSPAVRATISKSTIQINALIARAGSSSPPRSSPPPLPTSATAPGLTSGP